MKLWSWVMLLGGIIPLAGHSKAPFNHTLVLYGRTEGYLSPCGCTQPMSGGIKRAATVIRRLETSTPTAFVFVGGNASDISRQSELKAETAAESTRSLSGFYSYEKEEANLGPGTLLEISQLTHENAITASVRSSPTIPLQASELGANFYVSSISLHARSIAEPLNQSARDSDESIRELTSRASSTGSVAVLVTDGSESEAADIARRNPALGVVTYRLEGDPPAAPERVGATMLATTGRHGKFVITLDFRDNALSHYSAVDLGPDVRDDPAVGQIYLRYLQRVAAENLLALEPRVETGAYAGSKACGTCHGITYHQWLGTGHAHALADLDRQHHGRDPDCVSCHVTGLQSKTGFTGETRTPQLANVGCESCHGPAQAHARHPQQFKLPTLNQKVCLSCHTTDNSPGFDFPSYWQRIKHH